MENHQIGVGTNKTSLIPLQMSAIWRRGAIEAHCYGQDGGPGTKQSKGLISKMDDIQTSTQALHAKQANSHHGGSDQPSHRAHRQIGELSLTLLGEIVTQLRAIAIHRPQQIRFLPRQGNRAQPNRRLGSTIGQNGSELAFRRGGADPAPQSQHARLRRTDRLTKLV